ncbi:MAG: response regulator [Promethearchaeia archaeon]
MLGIKIFIFEDDLALQRIYREFFSFYGFSILGMAENGKIGLEQLKIAEDSPDLIIMDYHMPGKDGIETTKEIRKHNKEVKILFISAEKGIKDLALDVGACYFLPKPLDFKDLKRALEYCLGL